MRWLVLLSLFLCISAAFVMAAEGDTFVIDEPIDRNYEEGSSFNYMIFVYIGLGLIIIGSGFLFKGKVFSLFQKNKKEMPAFKELMDFVRSAVKQGHNNEDIKRILISEGWPKKEIELAIDRIGRESTKKLFGFIPIKRIGEEEKLEMHMNKLMKEKESNKEEIQKEIDGAYNLREREEKFLELKKEIKEEVPKILTEDVKKVLRVTDDLLGKMPDDLVDQFVHSPEFSTYKKVMKKVHEPMNNHKESRDKMDKVLSLMEKGVIDKSEARKMLGLKEFSPKKVKKLDKKKLLKKVKASRKYEN